MDQLSSKDLEFIAGSMFSNIDKGIIAKMVDFSNRVGFFVLFQCHVNVNISESMSQKDRLRSLQLVQETIVERRWGQKGSPWEFNLRDMFRWCQLMQADQSPGFFSPGQHVALVYSDRMRTEADKAQVPEFRIWS